MTIREGGWAHPLSPADGYLSSSMSFDELYCSYHALGGTHSPARLASALRWNLALPTEQHNYLATALNEHFTGTRRELRVGYRDVPGLDATGDRF